MPTLQYFNLRGRGEVIRLLLAHVGTEYDEEGIDYQEMKKQAGSEAFPFGQAPLFKDGGLVIAGMDAILRYLAREHNLYGSSNKDKVQIDVWLGGVEGIRGVYTKLIYEGELKDEAKEAYRKSHLDAEGVTTRNGGAHFQYLENLLKRNNNGEGWAVGNDFSIADIQLFDIVDMHLRDQLFPNEMKNFPALVAHHGRVAALENIANYLKSDKRPSQINGVAGRG